MADEDDLIPEGDDVFDPDAPQDEAKKPEKEEPPFRIFKGSRIAVSRSVGKMWRMKYDAAMKAYESIIEAWDQAVMYYNNNQTKSESDVTSRGAFRRGDSTENIVYSNLNVMLPAIYSKNPDVTCNTTDSGDADFVKAIQAVVNAYIKRRHLLNLKPKVRRASGLALLTNMGALKLDWTKKEDSVEMANETLSRITEELKTAKDSTEVERLYGELKALEATMEIKKKSGPTVTNVLPHNLLIDPYAEDPDGLDGDWMMEKIMFQTDALRAQFTQPCYGEDEDEEEDTAKGRVLVYKPTHKAAFDGGAGKRDDALGMVLDTLSGDEAEHFTTDERRGYINLYYTECWLVWDKITRRVFLFHRDDWTWPLWVWDDPLQLTRFFPYFIFGFGMSTGGTVTVGETSYYLDQQDEINEINRKVARIRRTVFDYFFYNSDVTNADEVKKFLRAVRGNGTVSDDEAIVGVRAGEQGKISDMISAFVPPQLQEEALFNKEPILNSINRISNTSDSLRGVQYKSNTTQDAVQSYQDAARLAVGAKVDVIEDTISDFASSLAELCVSNLQPEDVEKLVGKAHAGKWQNMSVEQFIAEYSMEVVAGSTEKPNSVYKKKEAIQVGQVLGQFASGAPITAMTLMLKVFEQAFTEVTIQQEDWDMLKQEMVQNANRGDSSGGANAQGQPAGGGGGGDLEQQLMNLPPEVKQKVEQMAQQGVPQEQIKQFLMQQVQGGAQPPAQPQQQPQPQPQPQPQ